MNHKPDANWNPRRKAAGLGGASRGRRGHRHTGTMLNMSELRTAACKMGGARLVLLWFVLDF